MGITQLHKGKITITQKWQKGIKITIFKFGAKLYESENDFRKIASSSLFYFYTEIGRSASNML